MCRSWPTPGSTSCCSTPSTPDTTKRVIRSTSAAPHRLVLQQTTDHLAARQGVDGRVDRLVRHRQARTLLQPCLHPLAPARYLLRRPAQTQQRRDHPEQRTIMRQARPATGQTPIGTGPRRRNNCSVSGRSAMTADLSRNRAGRATQIPGNLADTPPITKPNLNCRSIEIRQPASLTCHPTILNLPVRGGCSLGNLNPATQNSYPLRRGTGSR